MSTTDTRVVEMRFDNKQFESNAKQTMNTLDRLKKALEEDLSGATFESIDRAARNLDFSAIQSNLQQLTERFSTMGIVGMRAIENITDALMSKLGNAIQSVFGQITSGGMKRAQNIENARFQLQGLIDDEAEVAAVMKNASDSVDGTAYSYDAAAKAASMFAATGLKSGEQMESALKAIAGVAATTNSDYESMSQIFTTVSGQGKVMTDQLNQLANRGMNAAAALSNFFNGVKDGSIDASKHVKDLLVDIGATGDALAGFGSNAEFGDPTEILKAEQKTQKAELKAKQKAFNEEYKLLKKSLDEQYALKKKGLDKQYKALADSLDEEIKAVQKANQAATKEVQERYQAEIQAARDATSEKIELINEEYIENLKLIDEERYNKIKAIDDQIKAINEQEKAEEKARRDKERADKLAAYEEAINIAKSISYRKKLQDELSEYKDQLAIEDLKEERERQIENLQEQKDIINEEYDAKKEAERDAREEKIILAQQEGNETVKALQSQYELELEALRESQEKQIEALREARSEKLESLRETQQNELSEIREAQSQQLSDLKESQSEQLEAFREGQAEKLTAFQETIGPVTKALKEFHSGMDFNEAVIREMVTNGMMDFETFSEAMATTFGDHAKDANKTFTGAMSNIKAALSRIGALFYAPFLEQEGPMVNMFNAIRIKVNELKESLIPVAGVLTANVLESVIKVNKAIEKLDLSFKWTAKDANGNVREYNALASIAVVIANVFNGLINIFRAIGTYLAPITKAFNDIFKIDFRSFVKFGESFRDFTRDLGASQSTIEMLYRIFSLLFGAIKQIIDFGFKTLKEIMPSIISAFGWLGDKILHAVLAVFNLIDIFVKWLKTSEEVQKVLKTIKDVIDSVVTSLGNLFKRIKWNIDLGIEGKNIGINFSNGFLYGMMSMVRTITNYIYNFGKMILEAFCKVLKIESPSKETFGYGVFTMQGYQDGIVSMAESVKNTVIQTFTTIINGIKDYIASIDWEKTISSMSEFVVNFINTFTTGVTNGIDIAFDAIKKFFRTIAAYISGEELPTDEQSAGWKFVVSFVEGMGNAIKAIGNSLKTIAETIWTNLKDFFMEFSLKDTVNMAADIVKSFAENLIAKLKEWSGPVGDAISEFFNNTDKGTLLTMAAGVGIILLLNKVIKSLTRWTTPLEGFNKILFALKDTIKSVSLDIKASAILKIAGAVTLLSAAIVLLMSAFSSIGKEGGATVKAAIAAVAIVGGILAAIVIMVKKLQSLEHEVTSVNGVFGKLTSSVKAMSNYLGIKMLIDTVISDLGAIVITIGAFATLYKADEENVNKAIQSIEQIGWIVAIVAGVMVILSAIMGKENADAFKAMTTAFAALMGGILLMVLAINSFLNIEIDKSNEKKMAVLGVIILAVLVIMSKIAKSLSAIPQNHGSIGIGSAIAFMVLLLGVIVALRKLIKEGVTIQNSWKQLLVIGVILAIIGVLAAIIAGSGNDASRSLHFGSTLLAIPVLLLACILALKPLANMDTKNYINGLLKLAGIFVVIGIVCNAANQLASGNAGNNAFKSILAIGIIAAVLTIAIAALGEIDTKKGWKAVGYLGTLLLAMAVALAAAGTLANVNDQAVASLVAMVLTVVALGTFMLLLKNQPWQSMAAVGGSIAAVILSMAIAIKLMADVKLDKSAYRTFFAGLVAICVLSYLMRFLVVDTDWKTLLAVGGSIAAVILSMAGAIKLMANVKLNPSAYITFFAGLAAICVLAYLMRFLVVEIDWPTLLAVGGSIALVILSLGAAIKLMDGVMMNSEAIAAMVVGILVIAAVGVIMTQLEKQNWDQMVGLGAAIALVLVGLGEAIKLMNGVVIDESIILPMIISILAILVIGLVIGLAAKQPWDQMLGLAGSIALVLLACAVCIRIMNNVEVNLGAGIAFAEALVGALGIAVILTKFGNQVKDPSVLIPFAISIAITLIACAVVCGICGAIGPIAEAAVIGIGILDVFIADLVIILEALSHLTDAKVLEDGGEKLGLVGQAIGKFVGGIVEGYIEKMLQLLPAIGKALSDFAVNINPFFNMLERMGENPGMAQAAEALAGLLLALGAAELMNAVSNIFTWWKGGNSIGKLGEELASFGDAMNTFNEKTKDIKNAVHLKMVAEAAGYLIAMAGEVPNEGGKLAELIGDNTLDKFGYQLSQFAYYLKWTAKHFEEIKDISMFKTVSDAMKYMLDIANSIPNSGGLLADWLGDNTFDTFGSQLLDFSKNIPEIASNFKKAGIDKNKWEEIAEATKLMLDIANNIPNSGGWLAKFLGDNTISNFGRQLKSFSGSLQGVNENLTGVDLTRMREMADAMSVMVGFATRIKNQGLGEDNFFSKDDSLLDFGNRLVKFSSKIKVICEEKLTNISKFDQLTDVLERFSKLKDSLNGFNATNFIIFLDNLETRGTDAIRKFLEAFSNPQSTQIVESVTNLFNTIYKEFTNPAFLYKMKEIGKQIILSIIIGMTDKDLIQKYYSVSKAIIDYVTAAIQKESLNNRNYLENSGALIGTEVTAGMISEKVKTLYRSAATMIIKIFSSELVTPINLAYVSASAYKIVDKFGTSLNDDRADLRTKAYVTQFMVNLSKELTGLQSASIVSASAVFIVDVFGKGLIGLSAKKLIEDCIKVLIATIIELVKDEDKFEKAGESNAASFAKGFTRTRTVDILLSNFVVGCYNFFVARENIERFESAGEQSAYGFARGMINSNARRAIEDSARSMAQAAYNTAKDELVIKSPSKKMAQLGSFAGEGFVIGFTEWVTAAEKAGEEIGDSAKEGLNDAISKIASEIQNEDNFNPTITPVLDLSNLENDAGLISNILNLDTPIELASKAGLSFSGGLNDLLGNIQASIPDGSNADVVTAINDMRADMAMMSDAIRQMQIVMDTGELVGAISDPMDSQFGFNSVLVERGVR